MLMLFNKLNDRNENVIDRYEIHYIKLVISVYIKNLVFQQIQKYKNLNHKI